MARPRRNRDERRGQGALDFTGGGGALPPVALFAAEEKTLRALPEDTPAEVEEKRRRFAAAEAGPLRQSYQLAADLQAASFLLSKKGGAPADRDAPAVPTTAHLREVLAGRQVYGPLVGRAQNAAAAARAFHWPLAFPDVWARGGFDAVLGNPPWERLKLQEQEFFASRDPEIAGASNAAARGRLIAALREAEPGTVRRALHEAFERARRASEASSAFARVPGEDRGRFPLTGRGDVNTYALFAELFARLTSPRGRAGVIVPTGIATDATTAPFFADLVQRRKLFSLHDFQTGLGYFDDIGHARFKFCLLTIGQPGTAPQRPDFSFYARTAVQFGDARRHFRLSQDDIRRINPNTLTAPIFRTEFDAELTARAYARVPVLIDEAHGRKEIRGDYRSHVHSTWPTTADFFAPGPTSARMVLFGVGPIGCQVREPALYKTRSPSLAGGTERACRSTARPAAPRNATYRCTKLR